MNRTDFELLKKLEDTIDSQGEEIRALKEEKYRLLNILSNLSPINTTDLQGVNVNVCAGCKSWLEAWGHSKDCPVEEARKLLIHYQESRK
jgi:tmRNA-binding protein